MDLVVILITQSIDWKGLQNPGNQEMPDQVAGIVLSRSAYLQLSHAQ